MNYKEDPHSLEVGRFILCRGVPEAEAAKRKLRARAALRRCHRCVSAAMACAGIMEGQGGMHMQFLLRSSTLGQRSLYLSPARSL